MKHLLILCFLLSSSYLVFSQQADVAVDCPKIIIEGPRGDKAYEGDTVMFSIKSFSKAYRKSHSLSYKWTTPNGRIIRGENSSSVYISSKGLMGEKLIVSVIVNGLEAVCKSTELKSIDIVKPEMRVIRTKEYIIQGSPLGMPH